MEISFSKYNGLGNDFIFIDNRTHEISLDPKELQSLCHRSLGIGADGVVFLEDSQSADFKMKIFNADGHEAEMCGNALRCLYLFIKELSVDQKDEYLIETFDRSLKISTESDLIKCELGSIKDLLLNKKIQLSNLAVTGHFLNTGVPHFVVFSDNLPAIDVETLGREISSHNAFLPSRTNVNFISISDNSEVHIRTFERGVEKETLACGTGAAAAAISAHLTMGLSCPITVKPSLGENLEFDFTASQNQILNLTMKGSAKFVFQGKINVSALLLNF